MGERKRVYGYIRVSTETQADKGYGLETQKNAIVQFCKDNNFELIKIYSDEGISGALGDKDDLSYREGLTELLNTLNGTNTIVVMNTSRLWRDDAAKVLICRKVRKLQGQIYSIEQPNYSLYSKDPTEFLFNSLMEILDQYDRMCINLKLAKGRTTKAHHGYKPCGTAPYGYKWSKDARIILNENESKIVKKIYKLALEGNGFTEIANYLNKYYPCSKRNSKKPWVKQDIYRIIKKNFYKGVLVHQNKEIQGKHSPLVDVDTWNKINNIK